MLDFVIPLLMTKCIRKRMAGNIRHAVCKNFDGSIPRQPMLIVTKISEIKTKARIKEQSNTSHQLMHETQTKHQALLQDCSRL